MRLTLRPIAFTLLALSLSSLTACAGDDNGESEATTEATTAGSTTTGTTSSTTMESTTTTTTTTTDTTGETTDDTTGASGPSFAATVYPIIMAKCSCHVDFVSGGLSMADAPTAYANLVGTAAVGLPSMSWVTPGDLDNSYLDHKIQGTQVDVGGAGSKMPLGDSLTAEQLMTIEDWILGGASP